MNKVRKLAPIYILVYISLYYLWIHFWRGNVDMVVVGGDIFQFVAPLIAFICLLNTYLNTANVNRNFWLLLSLGCLSYLIGSGIWIYYELILRVTPPFPGWSDLFWMIQNVFYFFAFLLRINTLRHSFSAIRFFFDTMTIMVVVISLSWDFIIQPMLLSVTSNTFLFAFAYFGSPIGDLGLLFGALSLFLISDDNIPRKAFYSIFLGFLIKFIANTIYAYLVVNNSYKSGNYFEPLWSLSFLLIGLSGLYAQVPTNKYSRQIIHHKIFQYRHFLPYLFNLVLLVFVIRKHFQIIEVPAYGLSITVVLLMIRQILTQVKNEELLLKLQQLTKNLKEKNLQLEKVNQTLLDKEQQLSDVFDNLGAGIWSMDFRTNTGMISTGVEKILRYSSRDLLEKPLLWKKAVHPDDIDKIDDILLPNKTNKSLIEFRIIHPNDEIKWVQVHRTPVYDELGDLVKMHAVITDITEHKKSEEKIQYMAYYDELTGLPNRNFFYVFLKQEIDRSNRDNKVAVMFMDLDRFKSVKDTLGHHIGDLLLQAVSKRLQENIQKSGIVVCRIGGDDFTITVPSDINNDSEVIAEKIIKILGNPFSIEGHEIFITTSIGISLYPEHGETEEELVKYADMAMYYAKERGRNNYYVYTSALDRMNIRKLKLENALRRAIENKEFSLHYQPKVELTSGKIIGLEALIRWQHPNLGSVSPVEFIPIAEDSGLIIQIGEWVLKTACKQIKNWEKTGLPSIPVSVNVSAHQLNKDFVTTVSTVLQETKLDPCYLELEITETVLQNTKESFLILNELKELGIQLSLDDFGTGYSSLSYLQFLPVDSVKIDKSFIDDILAHSNGGVMVKTIIEMGRTLNFNVIAEGIENEHQKLFLQQNNCFIGQGYFFSPPLPADRILMVLKDSIMNKGEGSKP